MTLRQICGLAMLGLGSWLFYGAVSAVLAYTSRGGDMFSALFEPPTSFIRLIGAALLVISGILSATKIKGGGASGVAGALIIIATGLLMSAAGADSQLWLDEVIYGAGALALASLILTFRRV
ncbi:MAG: hypothetical protein AAF613_05030 [Pseudomonadota bacterium]